MMKQLLLFLALLSPSAAYPQAVIEREMACPVCGELFYAKLDVDSPAYDMRLDLKPVGEISEPWRLPECPRCGFVVYKAPLSRAETAACRAVVYSPEYKKALGRSSYYRAGLLYARLGKPPFPTANNFLKASWQEEADPARLREDQELALRYFSAALAAAGERDGDWEKAELLKGELLRRLGRFGEAADHFSGLLAMPEFKGNFLGDIAAYQLKLCARRDASPRSLQYVRDSKKPALRRAWIAVRRALENVKEKITGR